MAYTWTNECTAALTEYVNAGVVHANIAELLNERFKTNYNKSSVAKKLSRMNSPTRGTRDGGITWPDDIKMRLTELYNSEASISFTDIGETLKKEFGCEYTRNAVIACASRLGLKGKKPASSANHKPRLRIVAANGNSNRKRVIQVTEVELAPLRAVDTPHRLVTLEERGEGECCYIPKDQTNLYCGLPTMAGSDYCRACRAIMYVPPKPRVRTYTKFHGTDFSRRSA